MCTEKIVKMKEMLVSSGRLEDLLEPLNDLYSVLANYRAELIQPTTKECENLAYHNFEGTTNLIKSFQEILNDIEKTVLYPSSNKASHSEMQVQHLTEPLSKIMKKISNTMECAMCLYFTTFDRTFQSDSLIISTRTQESIDAIEDQLGAYYFQIQPPRFFPSYKDTNSATHLKKMYDFLENLTLIMDPLAERQKICTWFTSEICQLFEGFSSMLELLKNDFNELVRLPLYDCIVLLSFELSDNHFCSSPNKPSTDATLDGSILRQYIRMNSMWNQSPKVCLLTAVLALPNRPCPPRCINKCRLKL